MAPKRGAPDSDAPPSTHTMSTRKSTERHTTDRAAGHLDEVAQASVRRNVSKKKRRKNVPEGSNGQSRAETGVSDQEESNHDGLEGDDTVPPPTRGRGRGRGLGKGNGKGGRGGRGRGGGSGGGSSDSVGLGGDETIVPAGSSTPESFDDVSERQGHHSSTGHVDSRNDSERENPPRNRSTPAAGANVPSQSPISTCSTLGSSVRPDIHIRPPTPIPEGIDVSAFLLTHGARATSTSTSNISATQGSTTQNSSILPSGPASSSTLALPNPSQERAAHTLPSPASDNSESSYRRSASITSVGTTISESNASTIVSHGLASLGPVSAPKKTREVARPKQDTTISRWKQDNPALGRILELAKREFWVHCTDNPFGTLEKDVGTAHNEFATKAIITQAALLGRTSDNGFEVTEDMKLTLTCSAARMRGDMKSEAIAAVNTHWSLADLELSDPDQSKQLAEVLLDSANYVYATYTVTPFKQTGAFEHPSLQQVINRFFQMSVKGVPGKIGTHWMQHFSPMRDGLVALALTAIEFVLNLYLSPLPNDRTRTKTQFIVPKQMPRWAAHIENIKTFRRMQPTKYARVFSKLANEAAVAGRFELSNNLTVTRMTFEVENDDAGEDSGMANGGA